VPAGLRAGLTWVGLAGILVATVTFGSGTPFPGLAALLPVCAAGLVVAGGAGHTHRAGAAVVLGREPLRLVGDLSYAFYLWHWPLLVIAAQYAGHPLSTLENVALLAAAFVVSYVTYKLYENPLRHCRSLRRPRLALALWPASFAAVALAVALGTFSVATPSAAAPSLDVSSVVEARDNGRVRKREQSARHCSKAYRPRVCVSPCRVPSLRRSGSSSVTGTSWAPASQAPVRRAQASVSSGT